MMEVCKFLVSGSGLVCMARGNEADHLDAHCHLVHNAPAWAAPLRDHLSHCARPVKVLSPCVGVNAPERAAREMGMPWESTGDFDSNIALHSSLHKFSKNASRLHVGPRAGDVTLISLKDLPLDTDGVVSGPPCPPFSSIGARLVDADPRSSVFVSVALWIIHLATHGNLMWFVIENVAGILKRKRGSSESFAEWFVREMLAQLVDGWEIDVRQYNSDKCLLPQSRPGHQC